MQTVYDLKTDRTQAAAFVQKLMDELAAINEKGDHDGGQ